MVLSEASTAYLDRANVQNGRLPPFEVAKAHAFQMALLAIGEHLAASPADLFGERVDDSIARHLTLQGGGRPKARAVRKVLAKVKDATWYPGKQPHNMGGRPPVITEHQREEVARVAMEMKRRRVAPTPRRVRARLPAVCVNKETGLPMSDKVIHDIYRTRCFDDTEDDQWQWLSLLSIELLPDESRSRRVD